MGGGREAVCALAEKNLVDINLENLVLGQRRFDAQRQQCLVKLAGVGFFAGNEEVARHLHRDGGCALLAARAGDVGQRRAQDANRVDAAVLIEAVILGGQNRLFHDHRHVGKAHQVAPLFAKFANQEIVGAVNAQRNFGLVVGKRVDRRQTRVGPCHGESEY